MFRDRLEAGRWLGGAVAKQIAETPSPGALSTIVVGLPRGGVPVAREVALILGAPLTILVSKKIGAPCQPELALGAVTSRGALVLDQALNRQDGQLLEYVQRESRLLRESTLARETDWLKKAGASRVSFAGKRVIVVDDGVATGMTTLAALRSIAAECPARLLLAVPVIALPSAYRLQCECDAVVALQAPADLQAVGLYYEDFHQVDDDEMLQALIDANSHVRSDKAS